MPYACTIINLLKAGHDPSPPAALVSFAADEDEERTLFVARSRLPAGTLDLRPGDLLLAAGVPLRDIATHTDLVDALRGHLDELTLRVRRDGEEVTIHGRWPAAPMITERQGLWISGALFAESDALTTGLFAGVADLMVHHVEPGSEAEAHAISPIDLLISVDGTPVHSLAALEALAREAARADRTLSLLLMRISAVGDEIFGYQQRSLDPAEIEVVGPQAPESRAARHRATDQRREPVETSLVRR